MKTYNSTLFYVSGISSSVSVSITPSMSSRSRVTSYGAQFSTMRLQMLFSSMFTIDGIPDTIGVYVQMNYQASGKQVATLERAMGLSDEVILYLTLKLDRVVAPPADLSPLTEIPNPIHK